MRINRSLDARGEWAAPALAMAREIYLCSEGHAAKADERFDPVMRTNMACLHDVNMLLQMWQPCFRGRTRLLSAEETMAGVPIVWRMTTGTVASTLASCVVRAGVPIVWGIVGAVFPLMPCSGGWTNRAPSPCRASQAASMGCIQPAADEETMAWS